MDVSIEIVRFENLEAYLLAQLESIKVRIKGDELAMGAQIMATAAQVAAQDMASESTKFIAQAALGRITGEPTQAQGGAADSPSPK